MRTKDIDCDFQPEKIDDIISLLKEEYGSDNVLQCATFKTESLKSAILSAGRGLGFNYDDIQALGALVPEHRGQTYTLEECLKGNEEKGYEPVEGFQKKFEPYPGLFEAVAKIEGLASNNSRHASALYIFNDGYLKHNSLIRTPNGTRTTAFTMHDSDAQSALKMDFLVVDAQSKLAKCMELLLADGQIEWKGTLKDTYDAYLHPDVIDKDNPKIWAKASDGSVPQLFQFDTSVGSVCIRKAKPRNILQMAEVNSIMRLQVEGSEQPIDRYVRFNNDINEWYKEMRDVGLTDHEMHILEKYLLKSNGVSGSQETLMQILMDPEITNFTLGESNAARKAISKKLSKKIIQLKKDFYEKGSNTRRVFLDYVWKTCIEPQLGYAFSINHTLPYSMIAVQELYLNVKYNPLYWACACLCVNAGSTADDLGTSMELGDEEDEEEVLEAEVVEETGEDEPKEETKKSSATTNYLKIGKAILDIQQSHVKISPPDINHAALDFTPDVKQNAIVYGLLAVKSMGEDIIERILANRPYTSMLDFYKRVAPTHLQMLALIKAGAFDALEGTKREVIMELYLRRVASEKFTVKESLTAANIQKAFALGIFPTALHDTLRLYNFHKYIEANQLDKPNKRYVFNDIDVIRYFQQNLWFLFDPAKDEVHLSQGVIYAQKKRMNAVYKEKVAPLFDWLNSKEGCQAYYRGEIEAFVKEQKEKYCQGDIRAWEFDALTCYTEGHELYNINDAKYGIVNFFSLPEILTPIGTKVNNRTGKEYNVYKIVRIAGTVIGTINNKHILILSTPYGVVEVKFYREEYIHYNKNVSELVDKVNKKGETKTTKVTLEKSWFTRGNKLLISGVRRENMFIPKKDWNNHFPSVALITGVNFDLNLKMEREKPGREIEE